VLMGEITDVGDTHKCAYEQCECWISTLDTYCSEYCADADDEREIEIQCDCKHPACNLNERASLRTILDEGAGV
jgi:hypothetical protein